MLRIDVEKSFAEKSFVEINFVEMNFAKIGFVEMNFVEISFAEIDFKNEFSKELYMRILHGNYMGVLGGILDGGFRWKF